MKNFHQTNQKHPKTHNFFLLIQYANEHYPTTLHNGQPKLNETKYTKLMELTWKKLLKRNGTLLVNEFRNREVLVGMRA